MTAKMTMVEEGYLKWANDTIEQLRAELDEMTTMKNRWVDTAQGATVVIRTLRAELDAANKAVDEARNKLNDAIELAEEGISYTSPYFVEKWGMADNLAELKKYQTAHPEGKEA